MKIQSRLFLNLKSGISRCTDIHLEVLIGDGAKRNYAIVEGYLSSKSN